MESPRDWPIERQVEEYERRKNSPTVIDLCRELGITKQALHYRVKAFYRKQRQGEGTPKTEDKGVA